MNRKISTLVVSAVAATLFMSGCSSTQIGQPKDISQIKGWPQKAQKGKIFLISTKNDSSNSLSRASDIEESAYFTLQIVAETALEKGYQYFAVNAPKAMSNFDGSTITSMEEFIQKCATSSAGGLASAFDAFGLNSYYCNISGTRMVHAGFMEVAFYNEKPLNVLVWNANDVIQYLKKHDIYKKYNKDDVEIVDPSNRYETIYWVKHYRDAKQ
jgi:hypothetical protein